MRKLASILFVLSLLTASFAQVLYPRTASAEDVWVTTEYSSPEHRHDYYAQAHLIKDDNKIIEFTVPVKSLFDGKLSNIATYKFRYIGYWVCSPRTGTKNINEFAFEKALFDVCIPYSKYAQKYPR